jgi:hypothetical protein
MIPNHSNSIFPATKKAKFFFHPNKLPKDLTENQTQVMGILWDELCDIKNQTFAG